MENHILKQLFQDNIIAVPDSAELQTNLEGENGRKILLVVSEPQQVDFLKKILSAVGIQLLEDTSLLFVTTEQQASFAQMSRQTDIERCFVFGVPASSLGLQWQHPLYQPFRAGDTLFLFAHSLSEIESNLPVKRQLWEVLKELYPSDHV